jgi:CheY-like chemotaxis protein
MARILHVENEPAWLDIVRRALVDHQVDSAGTYERALMLLRDSPPYDLALVDLNLEQENDGLGGEILDLLKLEHPATKRIVVTARPPSGAVMANIIRRYGADEVLIKGHFRLPDLRRAVSGSLGVASEAEPVRPLHELAQRKAALKQRYRDWSERLERVIQERTARATEYLSSTEKLHRQSARPAKEALERWHALQKRFTDECTRLEALLTGIGSDAELREASEELEHAENRFANEIKIESSGTGI